MEFISDIVSLLSATLRISTPLIFAAMAGLFAERSGVIDFGLEGKMLAAAFVAATGSYFLGSPWFGLLLAIVACVSLSLLHGFASVTHKGDQVVSCVAINILMIGLTTALAAAWFGQEGLTPTLNDEQRFFEITLPFADALRPVPIIGTIYLTWLLFVPAIGFAICNLLASIELKDKPRTKIWDIVILGMTVVTLVPVLGWFSAAVGLGFSITSLIRFRKWKR